MMRDEALNIAIIGAGYWGKNLVRNFATADACRLKYVCDLNDDVLKMHRRNFPFVEMTRDIETVLADETIEAVAIATPVATHCDLATRALRAGKHVYVEKPLTFRAMDTRAMIDLAQERKLKLMVGHLLEYHPAVSYLKDMLHDGRIGQPYYMYTQRVNLGIVRQNENAWWSLAPHDISVICYLFGSEPTSVAVQGQCYLQEGIEDVVFATIKFADGKMAHVHCSWLDPHKIRKMTVVGPEKMVTFDDMEATEKIRIYDKGASVKHDVTTSYADIIALRLGDIVIPKIPGGEPLAAECEHFIACVRENRPVRSDGADGLRVVQILEAGQESLKRQGQPVSPGAF
ncbi:MAG: Gfo/Idh/MocA family oxidoreductase [Phycisphaerales bacterium]|nr:MAG: Gfo/Idh/MocA family oxidoreductase [Phycisphaerales bacterium]